MIILEALVFPVVISCPTGRDQYVKNVVWHLGLKVSYDLDECYMTCCIKTWEGCEVAWDRGEQAAGQVHLTSNLQFTNFTYIMSYNYKFDDEKQLEMHKTEPL